MLYACFQLLADFIEQERPDTIVDYNHDELHRREWKELKALHRYWKVERPREERANQKALGFWAKHHKIRWIPSPDGQESTMEVVKSNAAAWRRLDRLESQFARRENAMFQRLIKARHFLWC